MKHLLTKKAYILAKMFSRPLIALYSDELLLYYWDHISF